MALFIFLHCFFAGFLMIFLFTGVKSFLMFWEDGNFAGLYMGVIGSVMTFLILLAWKAVYDEMKGD